MKRTHISRRIATFALVTAFGVGAFGLGSGGEIPAANAGPTPKEVMDKGYANAAANQRKNGGQGKLVWPGLLRRLDRTDPSFRN